MKLMLVSVQEQKLFLYNQGTLDRVYPVSTAARGVGEAINSLQTPRGWHVIRAVIGENQPADMVYKARRPVGHLATLKEAHAQNPSVLPMHDRTDVSLAEAPDWIVGRILWLSGLERGFNRLCNQATVVDSMQRFIYIHGTAAPVDGLPRSQGCIRMRPDDVVALAKRVAPGDRLYVQAPTLHGEAVPGQHQIRSAS